MTLPTDITIAYALMGGSRQIVVPPQGFEDSVVDALTGSDVDEH